MKNPVVAYHEIGFFNGPEGVEARSLLPASIISLVAQGADGLIVPGITDKAVIEAVSGAMVPELAKRIKVVDANRSTLGRIESFVAPIDEGARELEEMSNEALMARILPTCLYPLALAEKYAGVASESRLRQLVHLLHEVDLSRFNEEAQFRLAQIASIVTSYAPMATDSPLLHQTPTQGLNQGSLVDLMTCSEYDKLVAEAGMLGLAVKPSVALRKVRLAVARLLRRPSSKPILKAVESALLVSTSGIPSSTLSDIASVANGGRRTGPPIMAVSSLECARYLATLSTLGEKYGPVSRRETHLHVHEPRVCGSREFHDDALTTDGYSPPDYSSWPDCSKSTTWHFRSLGT